MSKYSTFVRDLNARQKLWQTSEPFSCRQRVKDHPDQSIFDAKRVDRTCNHIVSSICTDYCTVLQGMPEVYLFAADENGEILDWLEMSGSLKGTRDHLVAMGGSEFPPLSRDPNA